MATINRPQLRADVDVTGANPTATLTVTYTVDWDDYDRNSRQLYQESWALFGADGGPGEDGTDDRITGRGAADIVRFGSDGSASTEREIVIEIDPDQLDEDPGAANTDELKVEVTLSPVGPFGDAELSNRVLVTV